MISLLSLMGRRPLPSGGVDVSEVFSTDLYEGNASNRSIDNGIDLSNEGGSVWIKDRENTQQCFIHDTERGAGNPIIPSDTGAEFAYATGLTGFNSDGFDLGTDAASFVNPASGNDIVAWTFREAPRFHDVVTYTGDGTSGRTVSHDLEVAPGEIIVRRIDEAENWGVYHRSLGGTKNIRLNQTAAAATSSIYWNDTDPTDTEFTLGNNSQGNASGGEYVAYLFAHDTEDDGIIQCGGFTTDGSGEGEIVTGWDEGSQYLKLKAAGTTGNWEIYDTARTPGFTGSDDLLVANTTAAETTVARLAESGGTITVSSLSASQDYIYMVIRAEEA